MCFREYVNIDIFHLQPLLYQQGPITDLCQVVSTSLYKINRLQTADSGERGD